MTDLFTRFSEDLQLKGLSQKTIKMYTRAVKQLTNHYQKSPEEISDEELRKYFLYNKNERKWSRVASTISLNFTGFIGSSVSTISEGLL